MLEVADSFVVVVGKSAVVVVGSFADFVALFVLVVSVLGEH